MSNEETSSLIVQLRLGLSYGEDNLAFVLGRDYGITVTHHDVGNVLKRAGLLVFTKYKPTSPRADQLQKQGNYHKEFKFTDVGTHNILYYKSLLNTCFDTPHSIYHAVIIYKSNLDMAKRFTKNYDKVCNTFCGRLIWD